jgi:prevent-host-death family protein
LYKASVGLREAKTNLSRLVKEVQKGTEIILTERGKPVARLTPLEQESLSLEQRLTKLEHAGFLEPMKKSGRKLPPPLPLPDQKAQRFLQEDRDK